MDYTYKAIVKKVYDGDTITVDIDLGFGIWMKKQKIRLLGINTPEIRGLERPEGLKAKEFLLKQIPIDSYITLSTIKDRKGKYGRWLGIIQVWDIATRSYININELLISRGFAEAYLK